MYSKKATALPHIESNPNGQIGEIKTKNGLIELEGESQPSDQCYVQTNIVQNYHPGGSTHSMNATLERVKLPGYKRESVVYVQGKTAGKTKYVRKGGEWVTLTRAMKVKKGGTECDKKCTYKVTSEGKYEIKDANSCRNECPNPLKADCLPKNPNSPHPRDCIISRGQDIVGKLYTQCEIAKNKTGCTWIHRGEWEKNCRCVQGLHEN